MNNEAKIQELEAKVEELTALVERMASARTVGAVPAATAVASADEPLRSSRRGMLKLAGAAAVGAAAAAATGALPAAADNGITTTSPTTATELNYTGTGPVAAFLFQSGNTYDPNDAIFPAALAGWASLGGTNNIPHGVYGYTDKTGYGIVGSGGSATSSGVLARGARSNLVLSPEGVAGPLRSIAYTVGHVINDSAGNVWVNVEAGTPGKWRKVAGPTTSGTLHLLATPVRVYDSRAGELPATAPKTPLSGGTRTIDCTLNSSGVPAGAAGLVLNVTALSLSASGYLSVSPGATGFSGTSTLNWTAVGAVVANSVTVGTGAGATIDVTVGGGGNTNFIVDVFGFYA